MTFVALKQKRLYNKAGHIYTLNQTLTSAISLLLFERRKVTSTDGLVQRSASVIVHS